MNLLQEYQVSKHLDNLHRRFGQELFQRESLKLEKAIGPLDEDVAPILAFRAAVDRNDRLKEQQKKTRAKAIVDQKHDWLLDQFMDGKSITELADKLNLPESSLRWYIQQNPDLKKVYRMLKPRRNYMTKELAAKINKMLEQGYTHRVIANTLHVNIYQVEYQQAKRQKAGLV